MQGIASKIAEDSSNHARTKVNRHATAATTLKTTTMATATLLYISDAKYNRYIPFEADRSGF